MQADVDRWAELELAPWRAHDQRGAALVEALRWQSGWHSVFFFEIHAGVVTYDGKPNQGLPTAFHQAMIVRCEIYRRHIAEAVARIGFTGSAALAIELADLGGRLFRMPVFAFQKIVGANSILIPDVDFFDGDFYEDAAYADRVGFDDKSDTAMFVGSTTGIPLITADDVVQGRLRRLRSAVFFKDHPRVTFYLPNIVQCDAAETEALIRALDVAGERRSWSEQTGSRFILSMDGNGATCSRVVLALKSNGVLLKYQSDYRLFYFHGLVPWLHYIPITEDADVVELLEQADAAMPLHRDIAESSRRFAETRLSREGVLDYSCALLDRYLRRFFA